MADTVTTKQGRFEIRSEAHGPHWVAWLARTADAPPEQSVLLVGQTQAEAEARARQWAERQEPSILIKLRKLNLTGHRCGHRGSATHDVLHQPAVSAFRLERNNGQAGIEGAVNGCHAAARQRLECFELEVRGDGHLRSMACVWHCSSTH